MLATFSVLHNNQGGLKYVDYAVSGVIYLKALSGCRDICVQKRQHTHLASPAFTNIDYTEVSGEHAKHIKTD